MFKDKTLDLDATGWDTADVYRLFGDSPFQERSEQIGQLAEGLRQARERYESIVANSKGRDSNDFYIVVVFRDGDDRDQFLTALGMDQNRFQDGRELRRLLTKETT